MVMEIDGSLRHPGGIIEEEGLTQGWKVHIVGIRRKISMKKCTACRSQHI
jgi:hypothetical protein